MPRAEEDPIHGKLKYMIQLQNVVNKKATVVDFELEDMKEHFDTPADRGFLERIRTNTTRYLNIFSTVIDSHMP